VNWGFKNCVNYEFYALQSRLLPAAEHTTWR
jgi:hypothetical protein